MINTINPTIHQTELSSELLELTISVIINKLSASFTTSSRVIN